MIDHSWAENALRCCGARIKELRPNERFSWAYYRIDRERISLGALYDMSIEHSARLFLAGFQD